MPKRTDLKKILVIGAGPIVIGQACEFDYSGTQACNALKQLGYEVVLINSNPATIMTDPHTADATYIEPIEPETVRKIILQEKPDALIPTIGGQTALNVAVEVAEDGFLEKNKVELIGADLSAIYCAEDRKKFKTIIDELRTETSLPLETTRAYYVYSLAEANSIIDQFSFPVIVRASFTLGGTGGAIVYNLVEFKEAVIKGLEASMINEIVVEESILGWKEYELEVMKDQKDNVVIICSIENFDPVGIHTGDSITVAPQQTLSDKEYQGLRDMSIAIIRKVGVATGGANIQFAIHPENGRVIVIEMNPRVSRSSALASKATGFPIAKIAAKLAVGLTLDEIPNDITEVTPSCFEPSIDYVVVKIPRFSFEKFSSASPYLGVQMHSVGETMSLARTFKESLQKAIRGLEIDKCGFDGIVFSYEKIKDKDQQSLAQFISDIAPEIMDTIKERIANLHYQRIFYLKDAFFLGLSVEEIYNLCQIDYWFLEQLSDLFQQEQKYWYLANAKNKDHINACSKEEIFALKKNGFSNQQLSFIFNTSVKIVEDFLTDHDLKPVYKIVDTCAGEFVAKTPYYYSSYDEENEYQEENKKSKGKIVIIGGGPNRIGQGIEFDYMCVQASFAIQEMSYESVIINSNPETVSTDYDVSDILFFEPLTIEDVVNILQRVKPKGIIVQLGGQTPLNLSLELEAKGFPILGTLPKNIFALEDRNKFRNLLNELEYKQPESGIAYNLEQAKQIVEKIGYPILVRPSFVLGGRAMKIIYDRDNLEYFIELALQSSKEQAILIDRYLDNAIEVDVDLLSDGIDVVICGVMEHIERAGVHSGDSACFLPVQTISPILVEQMKEQATAMALKLQVVGLMNIQFAIKNEEIYFIEANPRGSRTVPFVSKAMGVAWVNFATKVMLGKKIKELNLPKILAKIKMDYVAIKEAVLPFNKFLNEDTILGPEMKSTGEVMGLGQNSAAAFYKSQLAAGIDLPTTGGLLVTVPKGERVKELIDICSTMSDLGFKLYATEGTSLFLQEHGIDHQVVKKIGEGRPNISDLIIDRKIKIIYNVPSPKISAKQTGKKIRLLTKQNKIVLFTTLSGMSACTQAIKEKQVSNATVVKSIQNYYKTI